MRIFCAFVFIFPSSACASPEQIAMQQDAYCSSIGAPAGSPDYTQCRLIVEQQRQNQMIASTNLMATGLAIAAQK
jgi:hypothetical protein